MKRHSAIHDDVDDRESLNETGSRLYPDPGNRLARSELPLPTETLPLVKQALVHISDQAASMYSIFLERRTSYDARVSGMPVVAGLVSSRFGYRVNPVSGRRQLHGGLDLVSEPGSKYPGAGRRGRDLFRARMAVMATWWSWNILTVSRLDMRITTSCWCRWGAE